MQSLYIILEKKKEKKQPIITQILSLTDTFNMHTNKSKKKETMSCHQFLLETKTEYQSKKKKKKKQKNPKSMKTTTKMQAQAPGTQRNTPTFTRKSKVQKQQQK